MFLLSLPPHTDGETQFLKLRSSHHPDYMRIVLEGDASVIDKALVYQRGQNILVNFPDTVFSIQSGNTTVAFTKIDANTVMFYPGTFRGLKVFTLKHPTRLVIDVFLKEGKRSVSPRVSPREDKKKTFALKVTTVIIDPGHGGYDSGVVKDNYREKNVVLDIAKKLHTLINKGSSRSRLTRGSDRFMTMDERIQFTNRNEADIFLSIHIGNHSDIVVYVPVITEYVSDIVKSHLSNKGQAGYLVETTMLLNAMKKSVMTEFGHDMITVKALPYSMLSKIEAAALMIELPSFDDAYYIEDLKAEMANMLYKGLYIYEEIKAK